MEVQKISKSVVCCFMACVAGSLFFSMSNQAEAQIIYTVEGLTNDGPDFQPFGSPVGDNEAYIAVFEIDDAILDSRPDEPNVGLYNAAIISSTITFAEGHTSDVSFAGGSITIYQDLDGGGIALNSRDSSSGFLLFQEDTLPSDALLTDPQQLVANDRSFLILEDSAGPIFSFTDSQFASASSRQNIGARNFATPVLTVSAVPEPSSMALLGLGLVIASVRRRKS